MSVISADPTAALAKYLEEQMGSIVEDRIYRPELPKDVDEIMPDAAVVVTPGGHTALFGKTFLPMGSPLIDFFCYGGSRQQAQMVAYNVERVLQQMPRSVKEECCLCWARIVASTLMKVDVDTLWPLVVVTAQVAYFQIARNST